MADDGGHEDGAGIKRLVLTSDYHALSPLWLDGKLALKDPEQLGLSQALSDELRDWQKLFDDHFSYASGTWTSAKTAQIHARDGERLRDQVSRELGREWHVVLDLWPVSRP